MEHNKNNQYICKGFHTELMEIRDELLPKLKFIDDVKEANDIIGKVLARREREAAKDDVPDSTRHFRSKGRRDAISKVRAILMAGEAKYVKAYLKNGCVDDVYLYRRLELKSKSLRKAY